MTTRIILIIGLLAFSLQNAVAGEPVSKDQINQQVFTTWAGTDADMTIYEENGQTVYEHIYPNIDLVIKGSPEELSYEFMVYPGGNPSDIQLKNGEKVVDPIAFQDDALEGTVSVAAIFANNLRVETGKYELAQVLKIQYIPMK